MGEKIDYKELGLKAGLEIHQQLDTGRKLFCHCPTYLRNDPPEIIIHRKLHAVPGESGEVDVAAIHEAILNRDFVYEGYYENTCLLDYDECPPYLIDEKALGEVLKIALLMNCRIYSISQIMRKTVIDGSNTSGFQRTALIARNGFIETSFGKVKIDTIMIEEDAARSIEADEKKAVFRLDRLGIPLVEVATAPDMDTPEKIKETALRIGEILRSCKVRRGIGTIRQDLNLSIKGHDRVEVKGFQNPKMMIDTVNKEIERQLDDIKKKKKIGEVRRALPNGTTEFLRPMPSAARMYPETDLELLKISREMINDAKKDLPMLRKDIEGELKARGLNEEMIKLLFRENMLEDFKELDLVLENSSLIAKLLLIFPKEIASHSKKDVSEVRKILNKDILIFVLENIKKKKIKEAQIKQVLERILEGESLEKSILFESDIDSIEEKITKIIKDKPGLGMNAYMGLAMKEFSGKISGKEIAEIIKKHITH